MAQEYEIVNKTVGFKEVSLYLEFYEETSMWLKDDISNLVKMILNFIDHVSKFFFLFETLTIFVASF